MEINNYFLDNVLSKNTNFSDLESPVTPTNYVNNFKNSLKELSKIRKEIRKHSIIQEVPEALVKTDNKIEEIAEQIPEPIRKIYQGNINKNNFYKKQ